jgi:hypothetical protein
VSEKIIDMIKRLFEKAESAKEIGSLAEAESFFAKASELLIKHNLTREEVDAAAKDNEFNMVILAIREIKSDGDYEHALLSTIAEANFCKVVGFIDRKDRISVSGKNFNLEVVLYLYDKTKILFKEFANKEYNAVIKLNKEKIAKQIGDVDTYEEALTSVCRLFGWTKSAVRKKQWVTKMKNGKYTLNLTKMKLPVPRKRFISSFLIGAVKGLQVKFDKQKKNHSSAITALVVSNGEALDEFIDEELGETQEVKKVNKKPDASAFYIGFGAGMNIKLHEEIK